MSDDPPMLHITGNTTHDTAEIDPPIDKKLECILEAFVAAEVHDVRDVSRLATWAIDLLEALRSGQVALIPF